MVSNRPISSRFALHTARVMRFAGLTFNSGVRALLLALALAGEGLMQWSLRAERWYAAQCGRYAKHRHEARASRDQRIGREQLRREWLGYL